MVMNIILQGGGSYPKVREMDKLFFDIIPSECKILYIPVAMVGCHTYPECYEYITGIKEDLGKSNPIDMVTDLSKLPDDIYKEYGGIYIGGGNTFKLLYDLNQHGVRTKITKYISQGGVVCGGSAGAIIFGKDINTAPDANIINLRNPEGFNVLGIYSIWCHYEESQKEQIEIYVKHNNIDVIALNNTSGIYFDGNKIRVIGDYLVYVFKKDGVRSYVKGEFVQ